MTGGEALLALTHSSTGCGGDRVRLFEDMLEPAIQSGMLVQVKLQCLTPVNWRPLIVASVVLNLQHKLPAVTCHALAGASWSARA